MSDPNASLTYLLAEVEQMLATLSADDGDVDRDFSKRVSHLASDIEAALGLEKTAAAAADFHKVVGDNRISLYASVGRGIVRPDEALERELKLYREQLERALSS